MSKLPSTDDLPSREEIRRRVRERRGKGNVPGPTENPATNLMLADVVMRMGSYVLRGGVEKAFLKKRYDDKTAKEIKNNRSLVSTLGSIVVAKFATRSIPGAAIVGTGILGKVLYDHSKSRRANKREGDAELLEDASKDTITPGT
ncbi:hypothetical protein [Aurantiacibacter hainanensis]|uniref:hypothetical protein n=1 Tax=Aurantiacibacter hainanensis TaxID=3076114 RepID=UPI0030C6B2E0